MPTIPLDMRQQEFDRHLNSKAYTIGDAVWVFYYMILKGTRKQILLGRGPHKVIDVLQDGRLTVQETDQTLHLEHLKRQVPSV